MKIKQVHIGPFTLIIIKVAKREYEARWARQDGNYVAGNGDTEDMAIGDFFAKHWLLLEEDTVDGG